MSRRLSPAAQQAVALADQADAIALRSALEREQGAVTRVATALGVSADTIYRRITRYGLGAWLASTYPRAGRQPRRKSTGP